MFTRVKFRNMDAPTHKGAQRDTHTEKNVSRETIYSLQKQSDNL